MGRSAGSRSGRKARPTRIWRDFIQFFAIAVACLHAGYRNIDLDHPDARRIQAVAPDLQVHTEVHDKLMDRFTANEDLLAYMQTPAAQRFLESAPLPNDSPSRPVGAPFSRILWSVQVGVVLAAGALGCFMSAAA